MVDKSWHLRIRGNGVTSIKYSAGKAKDTKQSTHQGAQTHACKYNHTHTSHAFCTFLTITVCTAPNLCFFAHTPGRERAACAALLQPAAALEPKPLAE